MMSNSKKRAAAKKALRDLLARVDNNQAALARLWTEVSGKSVSRASVNNWIRKNGVPVEQCGNAERVAKCLGLNMSVYDFRPDFFSK